MKITAVSQLKQDLNFQPKSSRAQEVSLPVAWRDQLLLGFDTNKEQAVVIDGSFKAALFYCYPQLSLLELARLFKAASSILEDEDLQTHSILEFYGYKSPLRTLELFSLVLKLPQNIQDWCDQKEIRPKDLAILKAFKTTEDIVPAFSMLVASPLSKSLVLQCLELSGELILMERWSQVEDLFLNSASTTWLKELKKLRYPQRDAADLDLQEKLNKISWPNKVSARALPSGDQTHVEIKLVLTNPNDLSKRIASLQSIARSMEAESPWS